MAILTSKTSRAHFTQNFTLIPMVPFTPKCQICAKMGPNVPHIFPKNCQNSAGIFGPLWWIQLDLKSCSILTLG